MNLPSTAKHRLFLKSFSLPLGILSVSKSAAFLELQKYHAMENVFSFPK